MAAGSYRNFNTLYFSYFYILFTYLYILEEYIVAGRFQGLPDESCRSPMGIQSSMSVSDGSPIGLRWVSDSNNIFVNSLNFIISELCG